MDCFSGMQIKRSRQRGLAKSGPLGGCFNEQKRMMNGMLGVYKRSDST